jgi:RimJ/RimL family protein N-acetyltransferase
MTENPPAILRTERLRLRVATPADAGFYLELLNDPAFIAHIGDRGVRTLEAAAKAIEDGPAAMQRTRGHSTYVVELKDGGAPIGVSGLIKRDLLGDVDLGYAFLPQHRKRGYAFEAAQAVVAHARLLGITRLVAIVSPANTASSGLLLKLGMRFERFAQLAPDQPGVDIYRIELAPVQ